MVARRDAQARVAVDELCIPAGDRDIGHQRRRQSRAHRGPVDRRDDDLRAVQHVVDQVARLAPDARPHVEVARHLLHHRHAAAGREPLAPAAHHPHPPLRPPPPLPPPPPHPPTPPPPRPPPPP